MIYPSYTDFQKAKRKGTLIPVFCEQVADTETPVSLFMKICAREKNSFLLESAEFQESFGRYSFIGTRPESILTLENNRILIESHGSSQKKARSFSSSNELFRMLREFKMDHKVVAHAALPSFIGGLVGYFNYEFVEHCERINLTRKEEHDIPDAILFLVRDLIIYDHFEHKIKLVHLADAGGKASYKAAVRRVNQMKNQIASGLRQTAASILDNPAMSQKSDDRLRPSSNMSRSEFESKIRSAKRYIKAGDCIQVVLSQRFNLGPIKNDFSVYRYLRSLNPSPYMFYFKHSDLKLIGSSPEMLVRKRSRTVETRPIAGTRPRGRTLIEDSKFEGDLKRSKKELAEHLMLVDLGRNDLGRVCDVTSVKVENFAHTERFSHVMHLASDVLGVLKKGLDSFDLLKACFPAGTVSGAPKIRAMQIINELETTNRGPYAGAVGFIGFNDDADLCITIRTLVIKDGQGYVQAGAGIVNDSNPSKEYFETINKAKAVMRAVQLAEKQS